MGLVAAYPTRSRRPKRVFVAGLSHETNTFHPVPTTDFSFTMADGQPLPVWKDSGLLAVPGVSAYPLGGGITPQNACREAMDKVLGSLRSALPVDAVFLRLHGAMYAQEIGPAETVLVGEVRALVGPEVPIACTFDLHGNIPSRLAGFGDILVGYKTAPHTDHAETAALAGRILLDTLSGQAHPVSCVLPIPMILPGEKAMTTCEPFRSLVEEARRVEKEGLRGQQAKVLAATILVGCAWTDSPDTGMSVMITADGSRDLARAAAIHLARKVWEARRQFTFGCETAELEEGISRALAARESTVFLSDSGDNVTAGAPGDLPLVLQRLVERKVAGAVVAGISDPRAVEQCFQAGEGKVLRLAIGASVETRLVSPFPCEAVIVRLLEEPRIAIVRIGGVEAVLGQAGFTDPSQFEACGIAPLKYKIVVVKEGYLFAGLARIAPRHIMLLTPGAGDMRIERLTYLRRRRPVFPFEPDTNFEPESAP